MKRRTLLDDRRVFREAEYLAAHPGVADAVQNGGFRSGWAHYEEWGFAEGRLPCDFDEAFYLRSYALAGSDIAGGAAATALDHYVLFGAGRGYLPHPSAARPVSPSGGLWIDCADALDRVRGRHATGQVTDAQASALDSFIRDGFVILQGAIPGSAIEAALADLELAYRGGMKRLRFQCDALGVNGTPWQPELRDTAAKALDIHYFSAAIRRLILHRGVTDFLALIFENKAFATQTLGFLLGSSDGLHQDTAYVPYTCATSFAASWIALEDVSPGGGELFYYPGSHRAPDFLYDGKFKSLHEAIRSESNLDGDQPAAHQRWLETNARVYGLERKTLLAKAGDALIWHADLAHGGGPVSRDLTRKSVVTHYCPRHHAPLFCEQHQVGFHDHDGHAFTSSHYAGTPVGD